MQIWSAQKVGKFWISGKHNLLASFGAISCHVAMVRKKKQKKRKKINTYSSMFLGGPISPLRLVCGQVLVSVLKPKQIMVGCTFDQSICSKRATDGPQVCPPLLASKNG